MKSKLVNLSRTPTARSYTRLIRYATLMRMPTNLFIGSSLNRGAREPWSSPSNNVNPPLTSCRVMDTNRVKSSDGTSYSKMT